MDLGSPASPDIFVLEMIMKKFVLERKAFTLQPRANLLVMMTTDTAG